MAALFALMFIRLWYLQVLDTSAYSQAVAQNQVRLVQVPAPRGLILDRSGTTVLVGDKVTRNITLSRVSAQSSTRTWWGNWRPCSTPPTRRSTTTSTTTSSACTSRCPSRSNAPLADVLYIGEHASLFPGVSITSGTQLTYPDGTTGAQMLGYVRQINSTELAAHSAQGYQLGDEYGQDGPGEPVRDRTCGGSRESTTSR